jgi:hypothetical protein
MTLSGCPPSSPGGCRWRRVFCVGGLAFLCILLMVTSAFAIADDDRYGPDIIPANQAIGTQRVYIVEAGDSLWNISARYFESGWQWPMLWSFNPQVTNPHWIFPGDVIMLDAPVLKKKTKMVHLRESRYSKNPKDIRVQVQRKGFVPLDAYVESGVLEASREGRYMLGQFDEVYIDFTVPKKIRRGERFTIFRENEERLIIHPLTKQVLGYQVEYLGEVSVLEVNENGYMRALVVHALAEIVRGDRVVVREQLYLAREPVINTHEMDAVVISIFKDVDMFGEHDYVIVDRGARDGVRAGNRFQLHERGDGYRDLPEDEKYLLPHEVIGELMVLFSFEDHCVAIVTRSIKEMGVGAEALMTMGY